MPENDARIQNAFATAKAYGSQLLVETLDRWFAGPPNDINVAAYQGLPLLSVADSNLKTFEHDDALKSYKESNYMFRDIFGPAKMLWPIILFLSRANPPGVRVETVGNREVSLVYLGAPYSLAEITAAFGSILSDQSIQLVCPWFIRRLRSSHINPRDSSFRNFLPLSINVSNFLDEHREELVGNRTLVFVKTNLPDFQAIADHLGLDAKAYGIIGGDASETFQLTYREEIKHDFAKPVELIEKLKGLDLSTVLGSISDFGLNKWKKLPPKSFDQFLIVILFGDFRELDSLTAIESFSGLKRLTFPSGL